jgi:hypothetical protein
LQQAPKGQLARELLLVGILRRVVWRSCSEASVHAHLWLVGLVNKRFLRERVPRLSARIEATGHTRNVQQHILVETMDINLACREKATRAHCEEIKNESYQAITTSPFQEHRRSDPNYGMQVIASAVSISSLVGRRSLTMIVFSLSQQLSRQADGRPIGRAHAVEGRHVRKSGRGTYVAEIRSATTRNKQQRKGKAYVRGAQLWPSVR